MLIWRCSMSPLNSSRNLRMAWVQSHRASKKCPTVRRSLDIPCVSHELPPGVVAARKRIAESEPKHQEPLARRGPDVPAEIRVPGESSIGPLNNAWISQLSLRTEAGEELKRRRVNGPWFPVDAPGPRMRGNAGLAVAIASDVSRKSLAVKQLETLMYNTGTLSTKESLFGLWCKLCSALGYPALPLSRDSLVGSSTTSVRLPGSDVLPLRGPFSPPQKFLSMGWSS